MRLSSLSVAVHEADWFTVDGEPVGGKKQATSSANPAATSCADRQ
jgi:hypothetical protein